MLTVLSLKIQLSSIETHVTDTTKGQTWYLFVLLITRNELRFVLKRLAHLLGVSPCQMDIGDGA